jgi:mycofactocin system creatininase family protein
VDLGRQRWPDIGRPIVVVPVGSCEQHGPHLPLYTDTVIAQALATALAERIGNCVVAPALSITASGEHQGFAGTLSIGNAAMAEVVVELVRSADWAAGVVLVNGHGGNAAAIEQAMATLRAEHRQVLAWWPRIDGGDLHAGRTETSLMLAIRPDDVALDEATAGPQPAVAELVAKGVRALSPSGVLGDPGGASASDGRQLFESLTTQLIAAVEEWSRR